MAGEGRVGELYQISENIASINIGEEIITPKKHPLASFPCS
jgi:hypothetical protein